MHAIQRLKKRCDFLSVAKKGRSIVTSTMIVQWLKKPTSASGDTPSPQGLRIGYTTSRRVGNAVVRNRARRRLRALTHSHFKAHPVPLGDMVLIARSSTPMAEFSQIQSDFSSALAKLGI